MPACLYLWFMQNSYEVIVNEQPPQFAINTDGGKGYLVYQYHRGDLVLMHTYVPEQLRGKGIAGALAKYALEYARKNKIKVVVYCPYVTAYLERHPEYLDVVKSYGQSS